jgi:transposase
MTVKITRSEFSAEEVRLGRVRDANQSRCLLALASIIVETPPDPALNAVVRWRYADLKAQIKKRFSVVLSERSVGRILNERGFRKPAARPKHPEVNPKFLQRN